MDNWESHSNIILEENNPNATGLNYHFFAAIVDHDLIIIAVVKLWKDTELNRSDKENVQKTPELSALWDTFQPNLSIKSGCIITFKSLFGISYRPKEC